jgi:hypothetical protein
LELTCKAYHTGLWYDYIEHVDLESFLKAPQLLRRLEAHHKRVQSITTSDMPSKRETHIFLASLLPQLTSFHAEFLDFLPKSPNGPIYELSKLSRSKLSSLTIGVTKNAFVDTNGTMTVLQWLRAGLPNLKHLDIRIHIQDHAKDTLEAVLECCSSLQSLTIMIGPSAIKDDEFGPGQLASSLSSICLKNAKTLTHVTFNASKLEECAIEALGFKDGNRAFDDWNQRCKELFGVHLSNFKAGMASESVWDYALNNTKGSPRYADFDRLFELCYETLTDKIHAITDKVVRPEYYRDMVGFPEYFISKAQSWLPDIVSAPSEEGMEIVAGLSAHSPIFYDALKTALINVAADFCVTIPIQVVDQLAHDTAWVKVMGPAVARITDNYTTMVALLDTPGILLSLLKAADVGIFSCSRPFKETLMMIVQTYKPSSDHAETIREVIIHILKLHQAHPEKNNLLEAFLTGPSQRTIQAMLNDDEFYSIILSIFDKNEELKSRLPELKEGTFRPVFGNFHFGGASGPTEGFLGGGFGTQTSGVPQFSGATAVPAGDFFGGAALQQNNAPPQNPFPFGFGGGGF